MNEKGILVGADQHQEWLLSWWWERYSSCNSFPVVFVDFGMSDQALDWCKERGVVLALPLVKERKTQVQEMPSQWFEMSDYEKNTFQIARNAWFKKPAACSLSPFDLTVWMDLDCEVLDCLEGIFDFLEEGKEIAVRFIRNPVRIPKGLEPAVKAHAVCNTGVIVFRKGSELLRTWHEKSLEEFDLHWGDDSLLSLLVAKSRDKVSVLPDFYNWIMTQGFPVEVGIVHWIGNWGKECIQKHGGLGRTLSQVWSRSQLSDKT